MSTGSVVGRRVREVRLEQGMSQEKLAAESGVALRTIARIESGEDCLVGTASRLAEALDLDVAELLEITDSVES